MAEIDIKLLGPLAVSVDGVPVDLSSRKQRALLALLALHSGHVLSVDRLVDELWGERPPPTARHALQVHVSNLRKVLGSGTVATERPGYVLRVPPESCDALVFEERARSGRRALQEARVEEAASALADALALWRGTALADLAFEPFAAHQAARLEELRLTATEDRIAADLQVGRHTEVAGELEALVAEHPLREQLRGLLMLALYRSGRQVDALRAYQALRDRLLEDHGLDPGPELRELESAILRQDASLAPRPPSRDPIESSAEPATARDARPESRRLSTVVIAGLVGFDNIARALDPEDLRLLLDRCMARLATVVTKYDGTVDRVVGGELMAVFGAPTAHEDDPERAVRAAVDLQHAVAAYADDLAGLELRVGVSTGEVLFAASGPPDRREFTVMGDVVNEARRLEAQAQAGAVVIDRATRVATQAAADVDALDERAFGVIAVSPIKQVRPFGLGPFVGRDDELDLLAGVWRRAIAERRPQLVSILGEPGVGKSRLLAEFEQLAATDGDVVSGRCLPYGESLTYAPLAEALRKVAGGGPDDTAAQTRAQLDSLVQSLELHDDAPEIARHLALMTGLDDDRDRAGGLVDERILHGSTRRFLEALAARAPLCIVVEDVHWADDALLDLLQAIVRRSRGVPLMFVVLARPELVERRNDWGGGLTGLTSISLAPLDEASTKALVVELGQAHGLGEDVLVDIAAKSGGNPLFAEELVATIAEGDSPSGVSASLTSLLLARLDALPSEQQSALRRAAVIGMTFWPEAVGAMDPSATETLLDTMADLEDRDLLRLEPSSALPGHPSYSFKHVLIRDAAYASLPRRERQELHRAAADWLAGVAKDRIGDFSDSLAHHAVQAGQPERALEFLTTAADRSRRAASHRREVALLDVALAIAESLDRPPLVAELHAQRGRALSRLALWPDARVALEAALESLPADTPELVRRRAEVHNDLSAVCFWLLDTAAIREHAESALILAKEVDAKDVQLAARAQITSADSATGDVDQVLTGGRTLIEDARKWRVDAPYERLGGYSLQLYLTGDWASAITVAREAVRTGRERGDTQGVLWNMPHIAMAAAAAGRYDDALAIFDEARRFGEEYELVAGLPRCIAMSAGFRLDLFDHDGAEAIAEEARDLGRMYFNPSAVSSGIDLLFNYTRRGDLGRAEKLVDAVHEEVMMGAGWHGWLWRLRFSELQAEMATARGDHAAAIDLATEAIAHSRSKRRVKYEVFARTTRARALAALGRKHEAMLDLREALTAAASVGSPTLQVLVAAALIELEPDEATVISARGAVKDVLSTLTDPSLRARFVAASTVQTIISG